MSDALKKIIVTEPGFYLSFEGRVSRGQFLVNWFLPMFVFWFLVMLIGRDTILPPIAALITIWPNICLNTKRLHDRGKSGWVQLFLLIPLIGFLWWVWDCMIGRGVAGPNEFGPEPERTSLG
jgi:uncharacterized membrane protein YhaH (DUF805 family)